MTGLPVDSGRVSSLITDQQTRSCIDTTRRLFNQLHLRLTIQSDDVFCEKLDILNNKAGQLSLIAPKYDYSPEITGNGYRSLVKIINRFTSQLIDRFHVYNTQYYKLDEKRQNILVNSVDFFINLCDLLILLDSKVTSPDFTGDVSDLLNVYDETVDEAILAKLTTINMNTLSNLIYEFKGAFWLTANHQFILQFFSLGVVLFSSTTRDSFILNPFKYLSSKKIAKASAKFALYANAMQVKRLWAMPGKKISYPVVLASNSFAMPKIRKMITLKRKNIFKIVNNKLMMNCQVDHSPHCLHCENSDSRCKGTIGNDFICKCQEKRDESTVNGKWSRSANSNDLKMLLLHDNHFGKSPNDTVVLHLHGGGFISMKPKCHETYLRKWAKNLNGVPILSVDYSLSPEVRYPTALEEILEVYLFLCGFDASSLLSHHQQTPFTSEKKLRDVKVEQVIGFKPKNIVLFGDSAGSNLSLSLMHMLSDLNVLLANNLPNLHRLDDGGHLVRYPKALFLPYPHASVSLKTFTPSRIYSPIDPILPFSSLWSLSEAYSPLAGQSYTATENNNNTTSSSGKSKSDCTGHDSGEAACKTNVRQKCNPWFASSDSRTRRLKQIDSYDLGKYFYPLTGSFDEFKSIPLFIQVGEFDPLLDEGVAVARKWKGKVKLDILPDLTHGFLLYNALSRHCQRAASLCNTRLLQAINYVG